MTGVSFIIRKEEVKIGSTRSIKPSSPSFWKIVESKNRNSNLIESKYEERGRGEISCMWLDFLSRRHEEDGR